MNKIFKNRIFYILIFSALFILALNCNSFASDFSYNGENFDLSSSLKSFKYYTAFTYYNDYSHSRTCVFLGTDNRDFCYDNGRFMVSYNIETESQSGGVVYYYEGSSFSDFASLERSSLKTNSNGFGIAFVPDFVFCNSPIYGVKENSKGFQCIDYDSVVFQVAPQAQVEPLTEITQVEEIQPVVAKIVGLVLPACLTIFGTLLVLFLIKSKNLLQL